LPEVIFAEGAFYFKKSWFLLVNGKESRY